MSWLRRRKTWAIAAAAAMGLYALLGFFAVPWIARSQIVKLAKVYLDRDAAVERVRFNPFTLAATVEGFRLKDRDGGELLSLDRLRVDLQAAGIFRRAWRFREIRIERPAAAVRILADGKPSLADLMEREAAPAEPEEPFELPRLIVDHLVIEAGQVQFTDHSRQLPFARAFAPLNLEVRDLITIPEESGEHALTIGMGAGSELRWTGRQTVEPLRFTGRFDITGVELRTVWDYFGHGQPLEVADGRARVVLPYDLRRGAQGEFELSVDDASLEVRNLIARPVDGSEDWLTVPELQARDMDAAWPAARVTVGGVKISKPEALVRIEPDGRLNWAALFAPAAGAGAGEPGAAGPAGSPPSASERARPLEVRVGTLEIEGGSARLQDLTTEPDVAVALSDIALEAKEITSNLGASVAFRAKARVGQQGAIGAAGTVVPDPFAAEAELELTGVDVLPFAPYVQLPGIRPGAGALTFHGSSKLSGEPLNVLLAGDGLLEGVEIADSRGERLVAWGRMAVEGLRLDQPPLRVRIRKIDMDRPFAKVFIDTEGNFNLTTLAAGEGPEPAGGTGQPVKVEIGTIQLRDASIDYTDQSLILPFGTKIHSANGTLHDLSTFGASGATLAVEGRVAETGYVKVGGSIRLADPSAASDIEVHFRGLDMPTLTPYAATFAGYAIERGVLDLDVRYRLHERRLVGDHRAVAGDLVLGEKVEGAADVGLPVRLAVALLKDKDGRIDLEVPIEGTIDSPEFAYRKVVWQAVRTILGNLAKAPFRALGRLFGRDEEDLELVEFDPGRSDLLPPEEDKLSKLAEHIGPRAELALEVEGRFDPITDPAALRRMKLDAEIESRRAAAFDAGTAAGTETSTLQTILEALFVERYSAAELEAERLRFMPPAPGPAPPGENAEAPKKGRRGAKEDQAPPAPPVPPAAFNSAAFYDRLRRRLLEAQTVSESELTDLGNARSAAIVAALTASGTIEPSRVTPLASASVKRRKAGSQRIASEMTLSARRASGGGTGDDR